VQTLDDWCVHYYQNQIGPTVPWDAVRRRTDFPETRKAVLAARLGMPPDYEFALVDEGQDLDLVRFELLKKIAKHITVCVDQKQQIFDEGSTEEEIVRTLGLRRGNVTLLDAYRCCPYIVRTAAEFIPDDAERAAFLNQGRMAQTERQTLLLYMARDFNDEMKRLVEIVRERQIVDQRIAILFYRNDQVHCFTTGLREEGLEVETREALDFDSGAPKVLTLHSAKGLTFDTVIMPRLRQAAFPPLMTTSGREKLLFVGITCATKWVYFSAEDSQAISELDRVKKLSMLPNAPVTLQSWRDGPSSQPEGKLPREEDPDLPTDLLDLL
jgi:superfamily I DNA/RNA helicase